MSILRARLGTSPVSGRKSFRGRESVGVRIRGHCRRPIEIRVMTTWQISRLLGMLVLSAQLLACPAYAQDWFLPRTEQLLSVRHIDPRECANVLRWMVPEVEIQLSGRTLRAEGHPGDLALVRGLMAELDRPLQKVVLDARLLAWDKSLASIIGLRFESEGELLVATTRPPCFGDSYTQFRFVESQGSLEWLASKRTVTRPGKSVGLELKGTDLELNLDLKVAIGARRHIETGIQLQSGSDAAPAHRVNRLLSDGSALIITGFADQRLPNLKEPEEYVLVLVPHLMR